MDTTQAPPGAAPSVVGGQSPGTVGGSSGGAKPRDTQDETPVTGAKSRDTRDDAESREPTPRDNRDSGRESRDASGRPGEPDPSV